MGTFWNSRLLLPGMTRTNVACRRFYGDTKPFFFLAGPASHEQPSASDLTDLTVEKQDRQTGTRWNARGRKPFSLTIIPNWGKCTLRLWVLGCGCRRTLCYIAHSRSPWHLMRVLNWMNFLSTIIEISQRFDSETLLMLTQILLGMSAITRTVVKVLAEWTVRAHQSAAVRATTLSGDLPPIRVAQYERLTGVTG